MISSCYLVPKECSTKDANACSGNGACVAPLWAPEDDDEGFCYCEREYEGNQCETFSPRKYYLHKRYFIFSVGELYSGVALTI